MIYQVDETNGMATCYIQHLPLDPVRVQVEPVGIAGYIGSFTSEIEQRPHLSHKKYGGDSVLDVVAQMDQALKDVAEDVEWQKNWQEERVNGYRNMATYKVALHTDNNELAYERLRKLALTAIVTDEEQKITEEEFTKVIRRIWRKSGLMEELAYAALRTVDWDHLSERVFDGL